MVLQFKPEDIKTKKVNRNTWSATVVINCMAHGEFTMYGKTEEIAKQKLINFMNNEPYKHLDNG